MIEATDESDILRNAVYYLEPLPRWSAGRVVLLGDAAHATTPGVGQGAAQAIVARLPERAQRRQLEAIVR